MLSSCAVMNSQDKTDQKDSSKWVSRASYNSLVSKFKELNVKYENLLSKRSANKIDNFNDNIKDNIESIDVFEKVQSKVKIAAKKSKKKKTNSKGK